jgi:hypothetical protein
MPYPRLDAGHLPLLGICDLREAIAIADADIQRNWESYKTRFLRAGRHE